MAEAPSKLPRADHGKAPALSRSALSCSVSPCFCLLGQDSPCLCWTSALACLAPASSCSHPSSHLCSILARRGRTKSSYMDSKRSRFELEPFRRGVCTSQRILSTIDYARAVRSLHFFLARICTPVSVHTRIMVFSAIGSTSSQGLGQLLSALDDCESVVEAARIHGMRESEE